MCGQIHPILPAVHPRAETSTRATSLTPATWARAVPHLSSSVAVGRRGPSSDGPETAQPPPPGPWCGFAGWRPPQPYGSWRPRHSAASVGTAGSLAGVLDREATRTRVRHYLAARIATRARTRPRMSAAASEPALRRRGHALGCGLGRPLPLPWLTAARCRRLPLLPSTLPSLPSTSTRTRCTLSKSVGWLAGHAQGCSPAFAGGW